MGTRSAVGWKTDGEWFSIYNQFDGYPNGKGKELLDFLKSVKDISFLRRRLKECKKVWLDIGGITEWKWVDEKDKDRDWDRNNSIGYIKDVYDGKTDEIVVCTPNFLRDSISCEYGYIIDFDDGYLLYLNGEEKDRDKSPFPEEWYNDPMLSHDKIPRYPIGLVEKYPLDLARDLDWRDFEIDDLNKRLEETENKLAEAEKKLADAIRNKV